METTKTYRIEKIVNVRTNVKYYQLVREADYAILSTHSSAKQLVQDFEEICLSMTDGCKRELSKEVMVKTMGALSLSDLD